MKIGILGSGPSALYSALLLRKRKPSYEIEVFEKEEKLGKKLRATGNGHANVLPKCGDVSPFYNHPDFIKRLMDCYSFSSLENAFTEMGVALKEKKEAGYYPECDNANQFTEYLLSGAKEKGVRFHTATRIEDYERRENGYYFLSENGEFGPFDRLIIAPGAKSGNNLGSDGSFANVLRKHGYHVLPFAPGLCPIVVYEKDVKPLFGIRHEAKVTVLNENKNPIFSETGEVLWKEDGLSGIVIMNASSVIARQKKKEGIQIVLDLFPSESVSSLSNRMERISKEREIGYTNAFFPEPLADYLCRRAKRYQDVSFCAALAMVSKSLLFSYERNYPFRYSQVSVGGLSLDQIDCNFESKSEKSVYFAGEIIDIDGLCGGYNLLFDLLSALRISDSL